MPLHPPAHKIQLGNHADRVAAVAHDLAVALHRGDAARKCVPLGRRDVQQPLELGLGNGHAAPVQRFENEFPTRDRTLIAARFPLVMGVAGAVLARGLWRSFFS
jgi:hypothetical protein